MNVDEPPTLGPAADLKRLGVWENEGGCLPLPSEPAIRWVPAATLSDLPDESAVRLELEGIAICLARSQGVVHALLDECSHGQVALSDGEVEGGVIECWLHGSCFDLTTGIPTGPPAIAPVPVYEVRTLAGVVEFAFPALERPASS